MSGLSSGWALALILLVTLLWGSWFQVVKHTGKYPIYALLSWMYLFSVVIVWGSILPLQDAMIPGGVLAEITGDWPRTCVIFFCGMMYALGMQVQLTAMRQIGLILSTFISATCSILMGTFISALFGGLPRGVSFLQILGAALLLILATIICQVSSVMRDNDIGKSSPEARSNVRRYQLLLLLSALLLGPFYSVATSVGLRSELRPDGFSSLTMMGVLVLGAFASTTLYTAVQLTREKRWHEFLHPDKGLRVILPLALIAALCHFGGNVLHAIAAPVVGVAVATPLGYAFTMWSYVWGFLYGEFKGARPKTYLVLAGGLALFITGVAVLSLAGTH